MGVLQDLTSCWLFILKKFGNFEVLNSLHLFEIWTWYFGFFALHSTHALNYEYNIIINFVYVQNLDDINEISYLLQFLFDFNVLGIYLHSFSKAIRMVYCTPRDSIWILRYSEICTKKTSFNAEFRTVISHSIFMRFRPDFQLLRLFWCNNFYL